MRALLAILAVLLASPVAAQGTLEARWLSPTTAEVTWSGGGVGVCVWKTNPALPPLVLSETCGEPSGAIVLGRGGDYLRAPREGDVFIVWDGTRALAETTLGEAPAWVQRLVLVVRPAG